MAAPKLQPYFIILLFEGFLMSPPCHADNPGQCTQAVKNCTGELLTYLGPVAFCPQAELACLENLEYSCLQRVSTMISVFRYLCYNDTGVLGAQAANTCFADEVKGQSLAQAVGACVAQSMWTDSLEGEARCNAATVFAVCATTAAKNLCSGEQVARFFDKTEILWTTYGCFRVEAVTMIPAVEVTTMTPPGPSYECTLVGIKSCTKYLLADLTPVSYCPQDELTCLENLEDCDDANTLISVFRYLCNSNTGIPDVLAVNTCFAEGTKYNDFIQAVLVCGVQSMWLDTLEGQARCNAATTYAACAKTAAENQCSGDQVARFYNKTVQLQTSYGCFGGLEGTIMPTVEASTVTPPGSLNECSLVGMKRCTGTLLTYLLPVLTCRHTELACLENLDDCDGVNTLISVFRYLCNDDTGVMDALAVDVCFAEGTKSQDFVQAVEVCAGNSNWNDGLEGQARCSAATTYAACLRTAAENQCSGDRAATFYDNTEQLLTSYGCFGVQATTVMRPKAGKGVMAMPNLGMMAVTLGLSLMVLPLK